MKNTRYFNLECARTQCDSSEEKDYDHFYCKTNPLKHKTELCKTYSELGFCNYGDKCRFAHGYHQLIRLPKNIALRQRKCNGFWGKGFCNYGIRCQFGHSLNESEDRTILEVAKGLCLERQYNESRLMKIFSKN